MRVTLTSRAVVIRPNGRCTQTFFHLHQKLPHSHFPPTCFQHHSSVFPVKPFSKTKKDKIKQEVEVRCFSYSVYWSTCRHFCLLKYSLVIPVLCSIFSNKFKMSQKQFWEQFRNYLKSLVKPGTSQHLL